MFQSQNTPPNTKPASAGGVGVRAVRNEIKNIETVHTKTMPIKSSRNTLEITFKAGDTTEDMHIADMLEMNSSGLFSFDK